jgi:hypothetical protein
MMVFPTLWVSTDNYTLEVARDLVVFSNVMIDIMCVGAVYAFMFEVVLGVVQFFVRTVNADVTTRRFVVVVFPGAMNLFQVVVRPEDSIMDLTALLGHGSVVWVVDPTDFLVMFWSFHQKLNERLHDASIYAFRIYGT